ncbi:phosphotransferase [Microbacterium aurantiacum]|uniref:phosphotransferase n=1 Tax=Microbacterium aurantiacum TaxID=162393 RepID=UPI0026088C23|nr:phosphotransferase [Microbacterium aurantiacum]
MASQEPREVICHNDVAPYNMTFVDGRLTGLFDFDMASPGSRIWDLAYLAYRLVPWGEDGNADISDDERLDRTEQLIDAYGLPFARDEVLTVMAERLRELAVFTGGRLRETGDSAFHAHAAMYRRDAVRIGEFTRHR